MKFLPAILLAGVLSSHSLYAGSLEFFHTIRSSQTHLAKAEPAAAKEVLVNWAKENPEASTNPTFCYQLFFVALEGLGDRKTARLMLQRLDRLVASGELDPQSAEYLSVTESWQRAIFFADSDLPRLAHKIMSRRLSRNSP